MIVAPVSKLRGPKWRPTKGERVENRCQILSLNVNIDIIIHMEQMDGHWSLWT